MQMKLMNVSDTTLILFLPAACGMAKAIQRTTSLLLDLEPFNAQNFLIPVNHPNHPNHPNHLNNPNLPNLLNHPNHLNHLNQVQKTVSKPVSKPV